MLHRARVRSLLPVAGPAPDEPLDRAARLARACRDGAIVAGTVWIAAQSLGYVGPFTDAYAYWSSSQGPLYGLAVGDEGAYVYSPAFNHLIWPLTQVPWPAFAAVWAAMLFAALAWLTGPLLPLAILTPPVAFELYAGNIHLLLACAVVMGFRWPAAWALVLLTKVTPGVGLLWFVARREWGHLAVVSLATLCIACVSFLLAPVGWADWFELLREPVGDLQPTAIPIPLLPRVCVAVLLVLWGATRNYAWTVPAAAMIALPVLWVGSLAMLAAIPACLDGMTRIWGRDAWRLDDQRR